MNIVERFNQLGTRSRNSITNVVSSLAARGIAMAINLAIIPMTINFVNPTQYGIWLTLSSIIAWIAFFDLGLGNGMRNKFAEAKAKGDVELAKQYVSTTYFVIGSIVVVLFVIVQVINLFISWPTILKVDEVYYSELQKVFAILTTFFCLKMVVKLFASVLTADQRPGIAAWIETGGQLLCLGMIYLLTKTTEGSLLKLAAFYSGIPTIVICVASAYAYRFSSYRQYAPGIRSIRRCLVKDIMGIGIQFFIIYCCMIIVFQVINIVISRELGPEYVTEYNIANKYFSIAHILMVIVINPFWSAFTDAYHKNDFSWMRKAKRMLEYVWLCEIVCLFFMVVISQWFYHIWIGDNVSVGFSVSVSMAVFFGVQGIGVLYMNLINGIGTIRLQLIIYVVFALVSLPMMTLTCRTYGLVGIIIVPSFVYLTQAVAAYFQLNKLLNGNATGIWAK